MNETSINFIDAGKTLPVHYFSLLPLLLGGGHSCFCFPFERPIYSFKRTGKRRAMEKLSLGLHLRLLGNTASIQVRKMGSTLSHISQKEFVQKCITNHMIGINAANKDEDSKVIIKTLFKNFPPIWI